MQITLVYTVYIIEYDTSGPAYRRRGGIGGVQRYEGVADRAVVAMTTVLPTLGPTRATAKYAAELSASELSPSTLERTKQAVLDLVGIAIRACFAAETSEPIARGIATLAAPGDARAIGQDMHVAAHYAAFLNAAYAHTLDFDDTHQAGSIHPGATVIPAVLAIADEGGFSGLRALTAINAGYDVTVRLSEALDPAALIGRGFHPSAICGTFGAAAAVANLRGDDAALLENAFGLAGSFAAGAQQFLDTGGWNKRVHLGYAAHNGIVAYRLAAAGVRGAPAAFEGKYGTFVNFSGSGDPASLPTRLASGAAVVETATKPYPSCRYGHAPLDALLALLVEHDLAPHEIDMVEIRIPTVPVDIIAVPDEAKRDPGTIAEAQFSMYFMAAAAIVQRRFDWDSYQLIGSDQVRALVKRIDVVPDPVLDRAATRMPGIVVVHARKQVWTRRCDVPTGEPESALDWDALTAKFHGLASAGYDAARRAAIVDCIRRYDRLADVRELTALLGP